jgi:glucose-6-phosphate 1-dehydrogenase
MKNRWIRESWKAFAAHLHFQEADLNDAGVYRDLALQLDEKDKAWDFKADRIFYLALPPTMIEPVTRQLAAAGLNQDRRRSRLVVEKPFGRDLASARSLNRMLCELFEEGQIFRIDHYLGKETVQNILAFRFGNTLFEPLWNRQYIDHVQTVMMQFYYREAFKITPPEAYETLLLDIMEGDATLFLRGDQPETQTDRSQVHIP